MVENILYKVPNKAAMEAIDASLVETYPNLGIRPADLLKYEQLRDLGQVQKAYTQGRLGNHGREVSDQSTTLRAPVSQVPGRLRQADTTPGPPATSTGPKPQSRMSNRVKSLLLILPGVGWITVFMIVPCLIIFVYSFFERGVYGGIEFNSPWTISTVPRKASI